MAELTVRFTGNDVAMLRRWNAATAAAGHPTPAGPWPHRVILDITTAARYPDLAAEARQAGVPVVVDPLTHFWQDQQWAGHPWVSLPYASAQRLDPARLHADPTTVDELVAACLVSQLELGATLLITPYVHLRKADNGWLAVQLDLWESVQRWRTSSRIALPVAAAVALDWTLLARHRWPLALLALRSALKNLQPDEVLLAASNVDDGTTAPSRLDDLLTVIERLSRRWRVTALRQGTLGEACVIAGASGYETGIGWGERCDLRGHMSSYRTEPTGHPAGRPKYIAALGQSIMPATLSAAMTDPRIAAALTCLDPSCCPGGRLELGRDMRDHAVRRRLAELAVLDADHPRWAWRVLAERAAAGADLANQLNIVVRRQGAHGTRVQALEALAQVASKRRLTSPRRRGAA